MAQLDKAFRELGGQGILNPSAPDRYDELDDEQAALLLSRIESELRDPALFDKGEVVDALQLALLHRDGSGEPPRLPADAADRPGLVALADRLADLVHGFSERWLPSAEQDTVSMRSEPEIRHSVPVVLHADWQAIRTPPVPDLDTADPTALLADAPPEDDTRGREPGAGRWRQGVTAATAFAAWAGAGGLPLADGPRAFTPSLPDAMLPTATQPFSPADAPRGGGQHAAIGFEVAADALAPEPFWKQEPRSAAGIERRTFLPQGAGFTAVTLPGPPPTEATAAQTAVPRTAAPAGESPAAARVPTLA